MVENILIAQQPETNKGLKRARFCGNAINAPRNDADDKGNDAWHIIHQITGARSKKVSVHEAQLVIGDLKAKDGE